MRRLLLACALTVLCGSTALADATTKDRILCASALCGSIIESSNAASFPTREVVVILDRLSNIVTQASVSPTTERARQVFANLLRDLASERVNASSQREDYQAPTVAALATNYRGWLEEARREDGPTAADPVVGPIDGALTLCEHEIAVAGLYKSYVLPSVIRILDGIEARVNTARDATSHSAVYQELEGLRRAMHGLRAQAYNRQYNDTNPFGKSFKCQTLATFLTQYKETLLLAKREQEQGSPD